MKKADYIKLSGYLFGIVALGSVGLACTGLAADFGRLSNPRLGQLFGRLDPVVPGLRLDEVEVRGY